VRALLAGTAERTLDVQYYIWHWDMTGILLLEALHASADRGVRVRLLLDDNNISSELDARLMALDAHPNIEVRLFNPFMIRKPRLIGYITDFSRLNRRMHNKSFTADNQVTIIGGRNVGDEYFGAADDVLFADLDVMAVEGQSSRMYQMTSTATGPANRHTLSTACCRPPILSCSKNWYRRQRWSKGLRLPWPIWMRYVTRLPYANWFREIWNWNGLSPAWSATILAKGLADPRKTLT
jgi:phosphatidylserine/phosphatidylglycerophosphate/cardiolipin synthase-like enzyme